MDTKRIRKASIATALGVILLANVGLIAGSAGEDEPGSNMVDPLRSEQWALDKINVEQAWALGATGAGVRVAVIDSGVDPRHPDLFGKLEWYSEADLVDDDGDGVPDDGGDGPRDPLGHGTGSATLIAARAFDGYGMAGVAPNATIIPIRAASGEAKNDVLTEAPLKRLAAAIDFAVSKEADVISMSLGYHKNSRATGDIAPVVAAVDRAVKAGIVLVAGGGNEPLPWCMEPAFFHSVVCVGAMARDDSFAAYSAWDPLHPYRLVAPGGMPGAPPIERHVPGLLCEQHVVHGDIVDYPLPNCGRLAGFFYGWGNSWATPMVAGVAALLVGTGLNRTEVLETIIRTADDFGVAGTDPLFGGGRVNAGAAVASALARAAPHAGCEQAPIGKNPNCGVIGQGAVTDPLRYRQWALERIQAPDAWTVSTGRGTIVAVIDSGADMTHPDLIDQLIVDPDADFDDNPGNQGQRDCDGHGTRMIGIIAASTNNGIGIASVAPDSRVLPIRYTCGSEDSDMLGLSARAADAIVYATSHGADVISMSWETEIGGTLFPDLAEALDYAWVRNVVLVAAAGDGREPVCRYPARDPHVLCVGATDARDLASYYSAGDILGSSHVMAPSNSFEGGLTTTVHRDWCNDMVLSTGPVGQRGLTCEQDGYQMVSGTSGAAPFVSAIAALLKSQGLNNRVIVETIRCTSDDLGEPGRDAVYGWGRVNALRAVLNERNPWPGC